MLGPINRPALARLAIGAALGFVVAYLGYLAVFASEDLVEASGGRSIVTVYHCDGTHRASWTVERSSLRWRQGGWLELPSEGVVLSPGADVVVGPWR